MKKNNAVATNVGICFILMIALSFIVPVSADNVSYNYTEPYRLELQGQSVVVNDTIDISGQGWGTGVAWYGKYSEYEEPQYVRLFDVNFNKRDLRNFWLNPEIFSQRLGVWYQYYGTNKSENRGNLVAFKVIPSRINNTVSTTIQLNEENETISKLKPVEKILPDVKVSDYLVARGDSLNLGFDKIWLFGRLDYIYDSDGLLSKGDIEGLEVGSYTLVSHKPGNNTIYEVGYDKTTDSIISPWKNIASVGLTGLQPRLVYDKYIQQISRTDDTYDQYKLEVQEPSISIVKIDEVDVGNRIPIAYEDGMTLLDVSGYTNARNGTVITVVMDSDLKTTVITEAIGDNIGDMRTYQVYVPINKNQMPNGIHQLKASTAIGGEMFANLPISELPPDSFVPNASLKYIGDENPWKANMTQPDPIIIEKEIVKEVIVEVTPRPEVVYEQQLKAKQETDRVFWEGTIETTKVVCGILAAFIVLLYLSTVLYRSRK